MVVVRRVALLVQVQGDWVVERATMRRRKKRRRGVRLKFIRALGSPTAVNTSSN